MMLSNTVSLNTKCTVAIKLPLVTNNIFSFIFNIVCYAGQIILSEIINDMKRQFKQKRYHSPDAHDIDSMWQLLYPEHFINVLLIHHVNRRKEEDIKEVASIMRDGSIWLYHKKLKTSKISDMFKPFSGKDGSTIEPKLILIDGAPGMGKTTLCKEIAFQWANGVILKDTKILFLLFLRDPVIQGMHDLKNLIHYFYKSKLSNLDIEQCEEILKRDNSDITVLMDGFDELDDKSSNLLIKNIIKRDVLSQCRIVITSRPIASEKLQKLADVRVEVLGFNEQSKQEYIEKELKDYPNKIKSLLAYLSNHNEINKVCYIPIMMTILVCTCKEYEELPTNQSELYERFVTLAISRCLPKLDDKLPMNILSLNELPERYWTYLQELSKFAFKTIDDDKIVFSKEDIERISPNLASSSKKLQGLGLFKATEHLSIKKMANCVWYNFLHLSIHEFLTAYYLKSFKISEQFQILKRTLFIKRYTNVWVMFIGMQQNVVCKFYQFLTYIHIHGASDTDIENMKLVFQNLYLLHFSNIKNVNFDNIKGTFQLLCYKNNKDDPQTDVIYEKSYAKFDTRSLLQFNKWYYISYSNLFVSLSSVDNSDQQIEFYLIDKYKQYAAYYHIVSGLEQNQNLSVMLVGSNTLVGYRSNHHQLTNALKMNGSLETISLRYCLIGDDIANTLSSYIINSHYLIDVSVTRCKLGSNLTSLILIIQALKKLSKLKSLNLESNNMTEEVAEDIASVIKTNSGLEELYLSDNNLKVSTAVILTALKQNSLLKILYLDDNLRGEEIAEDLSDVIKNCRNLEHLSIGNNNLGVSAVVILLALKENHLLKVLNISSNSMTGEVVEDLAIVIKNNSGLEELYLYDNYLKASTAVILKALKQNSLLKILHLDDNLMGEEVAEDLADVIKNNRNLEYLCIGNNNLGISAVVILHALKESCLLKVLNLSSNSMTGEVAEDLASVIKSNSGLEELYLHDNYLKASTAVILKALKQNSLLRKLNLNSNLMGEEVAEDIADVIKNNRNLEHLCIRNNKLGLSAIVILHALKENSKLKILSLNENNITKEVVEGLVNVIKNNSGLEELYLSDNDLKLSAVVILQALKEISELKVLNLNYNNMTDQAVEDLACVIKNNPNLEDFRMRNDKLGSSAVMILQALMKTSKLKVLSIIDNSLTEKASHDLANVIRNNSGLENLLLSDGDLKSSAVVILQALKLNSHLKLLYLRNFLTESTVVELVSVIKNNPLITGLWLGDNMLQSGVIDIVTSCSSLTSLQVLELSHNSISPIEAVHLASVVANINSLQVLILGGLVLSFKEMFLFHLSNAIKQKILLQKINFNDNEKLKIIFLAMWKSHFTVRIKLNYCIKSFFPRSIITTQIIHFYAIQSLSTVLSIVEQSEQKLSHLDTIKVINSLFSIIKSLKVLDLEYSNIKEEAAVKLATALNCNSVLEQLWLSGNVLGTDGAAVILTSLQNITTLRVLDMSYNNISSTSADGIAAVINSNHFLEQLWLDGNMLMTKGVVIIASALKKHSNLRLLSLSNNGITEYAKDEISAIVKSNTLLEGLLLGSNQLQSIGTCEVAKSFTGIKFLHILDLTNNCINATATDKVVDGLANCTCLEQLHLGNNNLGTTGVVKICQTLKNIPILQVLSLNNNNITTEAASEICDLINTNTNLAILLLGGNDLQNNGVLQIADTVKNNNPTMQLLSLSDNNVDEQVKEDIKVMLCDQKDLELFM